MQPQRTVVRGRPGAHTHAPAGAGRAAQPHPGADAVPLPCANACAYAHTPAGPAAGAAARSCPGFAAASSLR